MAIGLRVLLGLVVAAASVSLVVVGILGMIAKGWPVDRKTSRLIMGVALIGSILLIAVLYFLQRW